MGRKQNNERIVLPCKFGKLVCEITSNDDDYRELSIDLYRNDGKAVQICVVGTNEYDDVDADGKVHVYVYDGEHEDWREACYVEPYGDGWWGEETI